MALAQASDLKPDETHSPFRWQTEKKEPFPTLTRRAQFYIDHPYYLTDETMQAQLRRSGFDVLAIDYAADHLHVGYICSPGESEPDFLTTPESVNAQWREIRAVQNPLP